MACMWGASSSGFKPQSHRPRNQLVTSWQPPLARKKNMYSPASWQVVPRGCRLLLVEISCKNGVGPKTSLQFPWLLGNYCSPHKEVANLSVNTLQLLSTEQWWHLKKSNENMGLQNKGCDLSLSLESKSSPVLVCIAVFTFSPLLDK